MNVTTPDSKHHSHSRTLSHSLSGTADFKHLAASSSKIAKGKQKEQDTWQFEWWDYTPLLEGNKPAAQWSSSSIIFTAHATEPRIICSHYPSNRQFSLSSPPPLQKTPAGFEPARVIATASQDLWVFAYFPGVEGDGVGCVWSRGDAIDNWAIKDHWTFPRGAGVVTARWLSPEREWASTDNGTLGRLPTLGPYIPYVRPVLFAVTEAHLCTVLCLHPQTEQMQMHSVSLSRRSKDRQDSALLTGERVEGPSGLGRVTHAAIGFLYEESCFLIATRSSYVPPPVNESMDAKLADLSMPLEMNPSTSEIPASSNWETWRDENIIEVSEITLKIEAFSLSMSSRLLPAITNLPSQTSYLTGLTFVPGLPSIQSAFLSTPTLTHRNVTPQSSPAMANASVMQSPGRVGSRPIPKGSPPKPGVEKLRQKGRSILYLLCSTVDVEHYSTPPKSEITAFWYARVGNDWISKRRPPLQFPSGIVVDLIPYQFSNQAQHANVLVATLDVEGTVVKHRDKKAVRSGRLSMLRMPECQIDESWESTTIECPIDSFGVTLPFTFVVSPNRTLVCAVSSSNFSTPGSRTTVHSHPMQIHVPQDLGQQRKKKQLAASLAVALHKRVTSSDVAHVLSLRTTTLQMVEDVLSSVYADVEINPNGLSPMLINDLIGATVEVYRMRSETLNTGVEKDELQLRCTIGQELCSFYACIKAWEYLEFEGGYDMDAVWYLTGLCGYFLEILQKLLKECVIFSSYDDRKHEGTPKPSNSIPKSPAMPKAEESEVDLFSIPKQSQTNQEFPSPISPIFLYLTHPYAFGLLEEFLGHVCRFRKFLGRLTAKGNNARMAKEVLSDIFDESAIDLDALQGIIQEARPLINSEQNKELTRRYLATLTPPVQCMGMFRSIISKIMRTGVVDKALLFMKADDLVNGMLGLSLSAVKNSDRDIVSKTFLTTRQTFTCVRCCGRSESSIISNPQTQMVTAWLLWEKEWHDHCVCGGMWIMSK